MSEPDAGYSMQGWFWLHAAFLHQKQWFWVQPACSDASLLRSSCWIVSGLMMRHSVGIGQWNCARVILNDDHCVRTAAI